MFDILVTSLDKVQGYVDAGWPSRIISVINEMMPNYGPHHLHLVFDDVHTKTIQHINPLEEHLQQILEFTKDLNDEDTVLVHCKAGISRSPAVAIGILIQHGMSYEDAYNHIGMMRPNMSPNKLITMYTDHHFKLDGKLVRLVSENEPFPNLIRLAFDKQRRTTRRIGIYSIRMPIRQRRQPTMMLGRQ